MNNHTRDPKRVQKAMLLASQFFSKRKPGSNGVWKNMRDNDIRQPLLNRIADPSLISQQNTNTCGPASYIYALAYYRPEQYAQLVLDMYAHGKAKLGKTTFNPDRDTEQAWDSKSTAIAAVDWVAIAGVKNSTSSRYDDPSDAFAGMTLPGEMTDWLKSTGWTIAGEETSTMMSEGLAELKAASREFKAGRTVFLFVKAKSIGSVSKGLWWGVDHWVVLASSIQVKEPKGKTWIDINAQSLKGKDIEDYQTSFEIYSWGAYQGVGAKNSTSRIRIDSVDDFIDYFYGYIAATPGN